MNSKKRVMVKIIFIGALNVGSIPRGGEEYKNQLLKGILDQNFNVTYIDTFNWKKKPLLVFRMLWLLCFANFDRIVLSASSHSIYKLLKFLHFFPSLPHKTVYFVIGGFMPSAIKASIFKKKYYESLRKIIVQGKKLSLELSSSGIDNNVLVIPNFKNFNFKYDLNTPKVDHTGFKFVFLSRIHPEKGIFEIFEAADILQTKFGIKDFSITFYGNLEISDESHFIDKMGHPFYYGGELDFMRNESEAYAELSTFDCMLFPTYWAGEGFPGVLIDAFIAGLPVIATDWNMNMEVLSKDVDSIIIPIKNPLALANAMYQLSVDAVKLSLMKENIRKKAALFHIDQVKQNIVNAIKL